MRPLKLYVSEKHGEISQKAVQSVSKLINDEFPDQYHLEIQNIDSEPTLQNKILITPMLWFEGASACRIIGDLTHHESLRTLLKG